MFYSDVDVSSILPSHIQNLSETTETDNTKEICGICHDRIDTTHFTSPSQVTSQKEILQLSCSHKFHYECLKQACLNNQNSKKARECALCRKPYQPMQKPIDDTYQPKFHKHIEKNDEHFPHLASIEWDTIFAGQVVYISRSVSKRPYPTGIFVRQSKQQATLQLEDNTTIRYRKGNLMKVLSTPGITPPLTVEH